MSRSTPGRSSRWPILGAVLILLALILGLLGYLVAGGERVLTYGGWQVQRASSELHGHVDTLLQVAGDMEELAVSPPATLVEVNDRLAAADRELSRIARRMQTMDVPPALAGYVALIDEVLVVFGEAMELEGRLLAVPSATGKARLLGRLDWIREELERMGPALDVEDPPASRPESEQDRRGTVLGGRR